MRISDWSSDVCSSDLGADLGSCAGGGELGQAVEDLRAGLGGALASFHDGDLVGVELRQQRQDLAGRERVVVGDGELDLFALCPLVGDRKSTRLNSSH